MEESKNRLIMLPDRLTAGNGAKTLLSGEFYEKIDVLCEECYGSGEDSLGIGVCEKCDGNGSFSVNIPVSWTTIKEIYKMIVKNLKYIEGEDVDHPCCQACRY